MANLDHVIEQVGQPNVLLPYQAKTVELLESTACKVLFVEKSRRIGLTWGLAAYAALRASRAKDAGGMDAMYISYSQEMTREFIDACAMWARAYASAAISQDEFLFDDTDPAHPTETRQIQAFRIRFASGFEILALSSAPRTLRGKQGLVIIDEAAFVDSLKELLKAALAFLMWGGQVVVCSTHNGTDNEFNVQVQDILGERSKFKHLRIDFDQALLDGLYQRICLVTGKEWSPEADRVIAALKTEQEIRRLGIDLYGQEAQAMRANTAELSSLAEQAAKAGLQQQLLFDRQQMFRSQTEQTVASTMRGAGLDYDPNSAIAQQIRYNEQLKQTKAAWEDIFSTVNDGIDGISDALFSGGSITEALKKAGSQLAKTVFDMSLTNPLKNWLTGGNFNTIADLGIFPGAASGKGGGFGGVLGQMLGAQKAVASMQVQAASVFINGSPLGVPGLGGLLGGSGFKADTTLSDLLGYTAANQNGPNTPATAAKLLAGLGSPLGFGTDGTATNSIARTASGGGVAAQVWNFFQGKGLKDFQIAGILGNVKAESAFNPLAIGDGGNAFGLFQHNDRAPALLSAIGGRGNLGDVQAQLQFAWKELQGSEGLALKKLMGSTDVRGATAAFAGFERPKGFSWADPEGAHNFAGRLSGAQEALSRFGGSATTATSAVSQLGGASSGAMSSLVSSTGTAAKGLDVFGSGAGKLGSMLNQFPAAPAGGGGGLFGWLGGLFGGGASVASMNAISPLATADILSGSWGLFANGAAFRRGNVVPFARGDVFSTPTYFPMSAGRTGVLGEDGEEAVMPLQRGPDGRLGVVNHQPLRAPRAATGNGGAGGSGGGITRAHIEGIVNAIADKLRLNANIVNLNDGSDIKRYLMSEDGHATVAVINRRNGTGTRG
ncbi:phage tail tip lysozyme [Mesorhizobium sp. B4-1-1]|uniref:phage tail tip lysozyme n=1 Tax=Mesorhizobium sp. B4-1-1 TaxID=2589890 RepID=UPI001FEF168F|nr:phage tail tip lysozyme [Mesorhizobium sp. B4-1-1]